MRSSSAGSSLDLTGEQPTPEQVRKFLADPDPQKRIKRIDELLASADFIRFWEIKLGDMLQISTSRIGNGAYKYQSWLTAQIKENAAWDAMVRTLLTALGDPIKDGGAANYALDGPDAKVRAEQTAQRFLGLRIRCAQCHDHPFDVWTQDDYFGLAACFAKVEISGGGGGGGMYERQVVKVDPDGSVEHLRTKRPAEPRLLDGTPITIAVADDPRKPLADWMTAPDEPVFRPRHGELGLGPVLRQGAGRPSRRPEPLEPAGPSRAARRPGPALRHHKYDLRDLIRTVATIQAYGLSSATVPGNERDTRLFSHQMPRPLTAHQMADALAQATDVVNRYPEPGHRHPGHRGERPGDGEHHPRHLRPLPADQRLCLGGDAAAQSPPVAAGDRRRRDRGQGGQPERLPRQPARPQPRAGRDRREPVHANALPAAEQPRSCRTGRPS